MANVIYHDPGGDEDSLVVWPNAAGRPEYGSYYSQVGRDHARADPATREDWVAAIDRAIDDADRNGIPTVYVVTR
ncbi:MAG TPA: hypothetical protein VE309_12310 [Caulobacteraceae bacterium]|jgi:hypothetical protein|nr:hypothetical protein [Caulobacteraceae bacterium]